MGIYDSKDTIDKIEFLTYLDFNVLKKLLPIEKMKTECIQILLLPAGGKARLWGYKSKIIITVPTKKCFELLTLSGLEKEDYVISYIEAAMDVYKESKHEAMFESYKLQNLIRKKYTPKNIILDYRGSDNSTKFATEHGKFSEQTGYYGSNSLIFVVYARISKINAQPCIHSEFKIRGGKNIKKRLGIETFNDCYFLDIKQEYNNLMALYIVFEEIDTQKLGKWILGWGRKKNFTRRQNISIDIAAITMMNSAKVEGIRTAAQLAGWFKNEKKELIPKSGRSLIGIKK
ncbi:hypothetical protein DSOUD_3339 [Desulfuromonas soudanensis]|uniref:Uncharacterized protein n=1 Tax=Desulfuromonas soudanensis TaxID=1603606 RepID=A0A0M3QGI8_9BACT|nr:hypothetical protein [Desulfuromonas soudanensis]ALC18059.1 hypothetical protein DSOUD_3339 [Desulfuromonas soudanensis]